MMMGEKAADLSALISGIRSHKGKEDEYISSCLKGIKHNIHNGTRSEKSEAVLKLWYLRMLGYDASWASFAIVEVMSNTILSLKRPGFFACATSFSEETPVALLTVNLFKKELSQSQDTQSITLTLSCIASMVTSDIARDIHLDVLTLLASSKPVIRRKAILCLFKMFTKYPSALFQCYPRIKELLSDDTDSSVTAAAVSVILELALRNPRNYVKLAPVLYKILSQSKENWVTFKILKLFSLLCPLEPRLPPKLHGVLIELLKAQRLARSVEFEALRLIVHCLPPDLEIVKIALDKIKSTYLSSTDINLKCVGLILLKEASEKSDQMLDLIASVFGNDLMTEVLHFVSSPDPFMRGAALKIMQRSVSSINFNLAAETLLNFSRTSPEGSSEYLTTLLELAGRNEFELIEDFHLYIGILISISRNQLFTQTVVKLLKSQLKQLSVAVPSLRCILVRAVSVLLFPEVRLNNTSFSYPSLPPPPPPPSGSDQEEVKKYHQGDPQYVESEILETVIEIIGLHCDSFLEFEENDMRSVGSIITQSLQNSNVSIQIAQKLNASLLFDIQRDKKRTAPQFMALVLDQLMALTFTELISVETRSSALLMSFHLLNQFSKFEAFDWDPIQTSLFQIQSQFMVSPHSQLVLLGQLVTVLISQIPKSLSLFFSSFEQSRSQSLQEVPVPSDISVPFFTPIHSKVPKGMKQHLVNASPQNVKRYPVMRTQITGDNNVTADKAQQKRWIKIVDDQRIAVYVCILGREFEIDISNSLEDQQKKPDTIQIGLECRCQNLTEHLILKNVQIYQHVTTESPKVVTLSNALCHRSKKTHLSLDVCQESLLRTDYTVPMTLSYEIEFTKEISSPPEQVENFEKQTITTTVHLPLPISLLLQPLKLDDAEVTTLMRTHRSLLLAKATTLQTFPLSTIPSLKIMSSSEEDQMMVITIINQIISLSASLSNFHFIMNPTLEKNTLNYLLIGKLWSTDSEVLDGLNKNSSTIPIIGSLMCSLKEQQIEMMISLRSNDQKISGRCLKCLMDSIHDCFFSKQFVNNDNNNNTI